MLRRTALRWPTSSCIVSRLPYRGRPNRWRVKKLRSTRVRIALVSYAMLGRVADAQTMYDRVRHAGAELTISQIRMRNPCKLQEDVELFIEGHRRAGVPE